MKDALRNALISEMKTVRLNRGLTQESIAIRLGVTKAAICNYETGRRDIPIDMFIKYCDACGVDAYEVLKKVQKYVYK